MKPQHTNKSPPKLTDEELRQVCEQIAAALLASVKEEGGMK